ncbi:MAG: alcohol dehydrogenase catalytic domain-containing protein [Methyloligellaceae bacterium]
MKALVYTGPERVELRDVADPEPQEGESVLEVEAVGICGSDMHAFLGHDARRPAPLVLGHEAAGTVVAGPLKGRRVAVNPLVTCGVCEACLEGRANICPDRQIISMPPREGAFAEKLRMPARNLLEIPSDFPAEKASLAEPVACGWHAVRLAGKAGARPLTQARAVVLGGGAIGLGAALVLAHQGVPEIFIAETNPIRHDMLCAAGPFTVYDPRADSGLAEGSVDLVVDAFGGTATRKAASALARAGGVIVHIGLAEADGGLDVRRMTLQEITFIGTYTYTVDDYRETLAAIVAGDLGPLDWIESRPLAAGSEAFADFLQGRTAAAKIVLRP